MSIRIALVTGGYTAEAAVSLKSASFVFQQLDKSMYHVYTIEITTDGWFHVGDNGVKYPVDRDDFTLTIDGQTIGFDLAFIMLHGSPGEDGRLQGYFDMVGLPYTSCDALTSALTMNKAYTKVNSLPIGKSVYMVAIAFDNRNRTYFGTRSTVVAENMHVDIPVNPATQQDIDQFLEQL